MNRPLVNQEALLSINKELDRFFIQSIRKAARIDPSYEQLWTNLHSLIKAGGKKLRPQMTILAYTAFGGREIKEIIPIAASQELLHLSLLIHDDIIDRDYTRYGVPNIAGQYKKTYSKFISSSDDRTHYANTTALLAGDLMLSGAHQLIAGANLPSKDISTTQQLLSGGIFEAASGELLDTELSFMPYKSGDALKIARYKTASYSFITPLLTGASLASAPSSKLAMLKSYATNLGIAYQLVDDLLGVFGDENKTGKSTASDIVEGKRTYLIEVALEALSAKDQQAFMTTFGNPKATSSKLEEVKRLLISSKAKEKTEAKIAEYVTKATDSLNKIDLEPEYHQRFSRMIDKITNRAF